MKIPRKAKVMWRWDLREGWMDYSPAGGWQVDRVSHFIDWDSPHTVAWLLTHPSGVYAVWAKRYGKPIKVYPDLETAKVAVELSL